MVVASRAVLSAEDSSLFVQGFYRALSAGLDLAACVQRGRTVLRQKSMAPLHHAVFGAYLSAAGLSNPYRYRTEEMSEADRRHAFITDRVAIPFEPIPRRGDEDSVLAVEYFR